MRLLVGNDCLVHVHLLLHFVAMLHAGCTGLHAAAFFHQKPV